MRLLPRVLSCALLLAAALPAAAAAPAAQPDPLAKAAGAWSGTAEYRDGKFPVTLTIDASGALLRGAFRVMQGAAPLTGAFEAQPAGGERRVRVSVNTVPPFGFVASAWTREKDVLLVDSPLGKGRAEFYGDYSRCVFMFTTFTGKINAVLGRGGRPAAAGKGRGAGKKKKSRGFSVVPLKL